jgi:hypothetical protein
LFHLEPVGIGTPETESLTSYATRLAAAHGVRVRELVVHELLPFLGRAHLADGRSANSLTAFWRNETRALNGTRTLARQFVEALETRTGRQNLRFLTLLTWTQVLPVIQLQRRARAWCPSCYQEQQDSGHPVYDPLLWTLAPVTVCVRHRRRLHLVCPFPDCRRPSPWLSSQSRPGRCARCGRWLGDSANTGEWRDQPAPAVPSPPGAHAAQDLHDFEAHAWMVGAVGDLIAVAPDLAEPPRKERVTHALLHSVAQRTSGNRSAWARQLGLSMEATYNWCQGQTRPSLWLLLEVCSLLGTTPLRLLYGGDNAAGATASTAPTKTASSSPLVGPQGSCTAQETRALAPSTVLPAPRPMPPLPSPVRAPPDVRRYRPAWKHTAVDRDALRAALEAILARDEQPPPSLRVVAQRLGQTYANLRHYCPDLCCAISARFLRTQMAQGAQTRQRIREEVRQAALQVHRQGVYPSAARIDVLLGRTGVTRNATARATWHEVLRELGWEP